MCKEAVWSGTLAAWIAQCRCRRGSIDSFISPYKHFRSYKANLSEKSFDRSFEFWKLGFQQARSSSLLQRAVVPISPQLNANCITDNQLLGNKEGQQNGVYFCRGRATLDVAFNKAWTHCLKLAWARQMHCSGNLYWLRKVLGQDLAGCALYGTICTDAPDQVGNPNIYTSWF